MIKKCIGCGSILQSKDINNVGFVKEENYDKSIICQRCFKMKNYGDYTIVNNLDYDPKKIFNLIKKSNDLVLFLCDIFCLDDSIELIKNLNNNVILVLTKKDLLPKSVKENKLIDYIKLNYNIKFKDILFVSSNKNYNIDLLYNKILKNKKSKNVYLIGNTNAGKSSLVNSLIKSYSVNDSNITTSIMPNTTLDNINIELNDEINLIDTPGIINNNYVNNESVKNIKLITPIKEIKPRTYQMKPNESLIIGDLARIDYISNHNNSFTLYLSNNIKVKRIKLKTNEYLKNLNKINFNLEDNKDIVINGLLFCKIVKDANVIVYTKKGAKVFSRNNLI